MDKEQKEIIKLTSWQILHLIENGLTRVLSPLDFSHAYKKVYGQYDDFADYHKIDWQDFKRKIRRLKQRGLIRKFYENKTYHLELTDRGKTEMNNLDFQHMRVKRPKVWDKKWRVVIYDIPEDDHEIRNAIREKLYQMGFLQIQKSIYIYPFECTTEVNVICQRYGERSRIKFMIADIVEGEESIIETFIDNSTLSPSDLA